MAAIHYRWPEFLTEIGASPEVLAVLTEMAPGWAPDDFAMFSKWFAERLAEGDGA